MAEQKQKALPPKKTTEELVMAAMTALNSRTGVSIKAIEKFIETMNLEVDMERLHGLIKRFIIKALADGRLVKHKGMGLAGSFRLPPKTESAPKKRRQLDDEQPVAKIRAKEETEPVNRRGRPKGGPLKSDAPNRKVKVIRPRQRSGKK